MNTLKSILKILRNSDYMLGALIITKDGMIIESNLDAGQNAETLGAFMSQVALIIRNSLNSMGQHEFIRYIMQSNQGRIYLVDLGKSVLIAMTELDVDPGKVNVALFQAANEIKKTGRIDV